MAILTTDRLVIQYNSFDETEYRWFYIVFGWIFAGSYGFYVYILYLVYGKFFVGSESIKTHSSLGSERDAVYPFLDFTKDYDLAVKYVLGMTFGAQSGTILKS